MKITVDHFQSLGHVELEAEGLTVIVGPSNYGKSALIRAVAAALFNRPGDEFVREGQSQTTVTLEQLPGPTPLTVEWTKGGTKNRYAVNGVTYDKVGQSTPPPLQAAGYRDLYVGDPARQKGEAIRPQVADQFDPLFLLTRAGSFINDVLAAASRLTVLQTATSRCTRDLKAQKQLLSVRQGDLDLATRRVAQLQPVEALATRVAELALRHQAAQQMTARVAHLSALVTQRTQLAAAVRLLPVLTLVPEALGDQATQVSRLVMARQQLRAVQTLSASVLPEHPAVETKVRSLVVITKLVRTWRTLRTVPMLPPPQPSMIEQCVTQEAVVSQLQKLLGHQRAHLVQLQERTASFTTAQTLIDEAEAGLATTLAALQICPVCERPMKKAKKKVDEVPAPE